MKKNNTESLATFGLCEEAVEQLRSDEVFVRNGLKEALNETERIDLKRILSKEMTKYEIYLQGRTATERTIDELTTLLK